MRRCLPLLSSALLALACAPSTGEDAGLPDAASADDAGTQRDGGSNIDAGVDGGGTDAGQTDAGDGDAGVDAGQTDAGQTDAGQTDAGQTDAGDVDAGDVDAGEEDDDGGEPDAGPGEVDVEVEAVLGERCEPSERIGLVEITSWGGDTFSVLAELYDAPRPWFGPPSLSDASCAFYEGAASCACAVDQVCAFGGGCADAPAPIADFAVRLSAGDDVQVIDEGVVPGTVEGPVTLPGTTFSIELLAAGLSVRTPEMSAPPLLMNPTGQVHGDFGAPTGLDLSWGLLALGAPFDVFTHIPMNHHVSLPSFTECRVDGQAGELHVQGEMLAPLALVTGLEFQALEPARFAAASTPIGCVEIRFTRKQFPSLF